MPGNTYLTGVTLITDKDDQPNSAPWRQVLDWLHEAEHGWKGRGGAMNRIDMRYGGDGPSQQIVYGGTLNFLRMYEFADFVVTRKWRNPNSVVLICDAEGQGAYTFRPNRWLEGVQVQVRSRSGPAREGEFPNVNGPIQDAISPEILATLRAYGLEPSGLDGIQVRLDVGEIVVWVN